jgi:hypothetical protein
MNFPNYKKGVFWGLLCGSVCAALWFGACYLFSKAPVFSEVSVSLALQPWWKFWGTGVVIFITVTLVIGMLAAFKPSFPKSKSHFSKH